MDAVVAGFLLAFAVHAAARLDDDVRAFAHIEVVVDQVVHAGVGDAGGDVHRLALGAGLDVDDKARRVGLGLDEDVLAGLAGGALAVLPDVISPFELAALDAADEAQQFVGDLVHTRASSFSSGQRTAFSFASRVGSTSAAGPA